MKAISFALVGATALSLAVLPVMPAIPRAEAAAAVAPSMATQKSVVSAARGERVRRPLALVYRGPASCDGCAESVAHLLSASRYRFRIAYVGPGESRQLTASSFAGATLYAQPGGDESVAEADRLVGHVGKRAISRFVRRGGRYLGFCEGAYLAGSHPGIGLLAPGDTGAYIDTPGASVTTEADSIIPVTWGDRTYDMYFQDGAYMIPSNVGGERILARYSNGLVAALVKPFGRGRVGVVGPHPEAERDWYDGALWSQDRDQLDGSLGQALIDATMAKR